MYTKGYARPRILFILPASVNWMGRKVLLTGQEKTTSPPPSGGAPLFNICKSKSWFLTYCPVGSP